MICTAGSLVCRDRAGHPGTILARMESSCVGEDQQGWVCAKAFTTAIVLLTSRGYCLRCRTPNENHITYTVLEEVSATS